MEHEVHLFIIDHRFSVGASAQEFSAWLSAQGDSDLQPQKREWHHLYGDVTADSLVLAADTYYFVLRPMGRERTEVLAHFHQSEEESKAEDFAQYHSFTSFLNLIGNLWGVPSLVELMALPGAPVEPEPTSQVKTPVPRKRGGGPTPTPPEQREAMVAGWLWANKFERQSQEGYCTKIGIGVSTLGKYMRELEAKGELPTPRKYTPDVS